jgi:hypothetical protein
MEQQKLFRDGVALARISNKMLSNNTPHASRKISAPRGVTCFFGGDI